MSFDYVEVNVQFEYELKRGITSINTPFSRVSSF
jgi:hypothetical protein